MLDLGDWGEGTTHEKVVVGEDWTKIKFKRCDRMAIIASTPNTSFFASASRQPPGTEEGLPFVRDTMGPQTSQPAAIRLTRQGFAPPIYVRGSNAGDTVIVIRTFKE